MGRDWNEPEGVVDRYQPDDEGAPRPRKRRDKNKDRRRWCKGRVGIPHIWLWENHPRGTNSSDRRLWQTLVCFGCQRHSHRSRMVCLTCGGSTWAWMGDDGEYKCRCEEYVRRRARLRNWQAQGQEVKR